MNNEKALKAIIKRIENYGDMKIICPHGNGFMAEAVGDRAKAMGDLGDLFSFEHDNGEMVIKRHPRPFETKRIKLEGAK